MGQGPLQVFCSGLWMVIVISCAHCKLNETFGRREGFQLFHINFSRPLNQPPPLPVRGPRLMTLLPTLWTAPCRQLVSEYVSKGCRSKAVRGQAKATLSADGGSWPADCIQWSPTRIKITPYGQ